MTNLEAQVFNDSAHHALMLAEQLQQQAIRENLLKLVRVWLATVRDAEHASDTHVDAS
jgi:L-amino acid N-acyltransferase YncA